MDDQNQHNIVKQLSSNLKNKHKKYIWFMTALSVCVCFKLCHLAVLDLSYRMWYLVPWPRIEPWAPCIGAQSLVTKTQKKSREVTALIFMLYL